MQLTKLSILISTIIIVNTICHIRRLLHFYHKGTCPNTMYTASRYIEHITRPDSTCLKHLVKCTIMYTFFIFFWSDLLGETRYQSGPFIGRNNIPHFIFTKTVMTFFGQFIAWMNLNRQFLPRINKLNQQRELIAKTCIIRLANQFFPILTYHFGQCQPFVCAISHNRFAAFYS